MKFLMRLPWLTLLVCAGLVMYFYPDLKKFLDDKIPSVGEMLTKK
ncbi:hypothetical protein [Flavobacterium sp.]|nr:hypothetical protein [Flavobacterium sp.]